MSSDIQSMQHSKHSKSQAHRKDTKMFCEPPSTLFLAPLKINFQFSYLPSIHFLAFMSVFCSSSFSLSLPTPFTSIFFSHPLHPNPPLIHPFLSPHYPLLPQQSKDTLTGAPLLFICLFVVISFFFFYGF